MAGMKASVPDVVKVEHEHGRRKTDVSNCDRYRRSEHVREKVDEEIRLSTNRGRLGDGPEWLC